LSGLAVGRYLGSWMLLSTGTLLPRHCFESIAPEIFHMHIWFNPIRTTLADRVQGKHMAKLKPISLLTRVTHGNDVSVTSVLHAMFRLLSPSHRLGTVSAVSILHRCNPDGTHLPWSGRCNGRNPSLARSLHIVAIDICYSQLSPPQSGEEIT
jgi:hypothetical protein